MSFEDNWIAFAKLCLRAKNPEQLKKLFDLFLTFEEKRTLASRYQIIKTLMESKLTQREIAEQFKVSISQITRGSNALKIVDEEILGLLKENL